jgi:hypothetical protein
MEQPTRVWDTLRDQITLDRTVRAGAVLVAGIVLAGCASSSGAPQETAELSPVSTASTTTPEVQTTDTPETDEPTQEPMDSPTSEVDKPTPTTTQTPYHVKLAPRVCPTGFKPARPVVSYGDPGIVADSKKAPPDPGSVTDHRATPNDPGFGVNKRRASTVVCIKIPR